VSAIPVRVDAVAPANVMRERGSHQCCMNAVQRSYM
jgi:hypothetical protein